MNFPRDIICEIASYITDPRDIIRLMGVSKNNRETLFRCVTVLRWNPPYPESLTIPISFISQFQNLQQIEVPIFIYGFDINLVYILSKFNNLKFINISFDLSEIKGELDNIIIINYLTEILKNYAAIYHHIPDFQFHIIYINMYTDRQYIITLIFKNHILVCYTNWFIEFSTIYLLLSLLDKYTRLIGISPIQYFTSHDNETLNNFSFLHEIIIIRNYEGILTSSEIEKSLSMLNFGYFDTIIYPQELWSNKYIDSINSDIYVRYFDYITSSISSLNKSFYLELPITRGIYNSSFDKLLLLKNIKVLGIYLNTRDFQVNFIHTFEIEKFAEFLKRLVDNFPIEKLLFYSERKWTELPYFLQTINTKNLSQYLSIFEYRQVRNDMIL